MRLPALARWRDLRMLDRCGDTGSGRTSFEHFGASAPPTPMPDTPEVPEAAEMICGRGSGKGGKGKCKRCGKGKLHLSALISA